MKTTCRQTGGIVCRPVYLTGLGMYVPGTGNTTGKRTVMAYHQGASLDGILFIADPSPWQPHGEHPKTYVLN